MNCEGKKSSAHFVKNRSFADLNDMKIRLSIFLGEKLMQNVDLDSYYCLFVYIRFFYRGFHVWCNPLYQYGMSFSLKRLILPHASTANRLMSMLFLLLLILLIYGERHINSCINCHRNDLSVINEQQLAKYHQTTRVGRICSVFFFFEILFL